jgi:hypothetical protein
MQPVPKSRQLAAAVKGDCIVWVPVLFVHDD